MSNIETTPSYSGVSTDFDRNSEGFRFGLGIDDIQIEQLRNRLPEAGFWIDGITREALNDGFELLDPKTDKPLPIDAEFQDFLVKTNFMREFIQLIGHARAHGRSMALVFGKDKSKGKMKAFTFPDIKTRMDSEGIFLDRVTLTERFAHNLRTDIEHTIDLKGDETDPVVDVIFSEKQKTMEGKSKIELIWDILNAIYIIQFASTIYSVRVGAGLKIAFTDTDPTSTEGQFIETSLRNLNDTTTLILPRDDDVKIVGSEGGMVDYTKLLDVKYTALAAATGIPKAQWMGDSLGQLAGAETGKNKLLEIHKTIQDESSPFLKILLRLISSFMGFGLQENFEIGWNFKELVDEKGAADKELVLAQTDALDQSIMTLNELRERRGLEPLLNVDGADTLPYTFLLSKINKIKIEVDGAEINEPDDTEQQSNGIFGQPTEEPEQESTDDTTDKSGSDTNGTTGPPDQFGTVS